MKNPIENIADIDIYYDNTENECVEEVDFVPQPGSLWLVIVECRYNVIAVCVSGRGFYIPGQWPCWGFSHVDRWIEEIVPPPY